MSDSGQLSFPGDKQSDLEWMRAVVKERKLNDVTDHHLQLFWGHAGGDRQMAVEAITAIHAGKLYEPLRSLVDARRGISG